MRNIKVTIWNEFREEKDNKEAAVMYPKGIHTALAEQLAKFDELEVRTAILDEPEQGLSDEILNGTDVLLWWGHKAHREVRDEIVEKVYRRVLDGMGLIVLHSGHASKIFKKLVGTESGRLKWREAGEKERLWVIDPGHPIVDGIGEYIELEKEETYGEHFEIPNPDSLVFVSWFEGGEVFRSGCCFIRGKGKIFYFRPGHETYPTYYNPDILKVLCNSIKWAAPIDGPKFIYGNTDSLEKYK